MTAGPDYKELSDMELFSRFAEDDHFAFKELFNRHLRSLHMYARSILTDRDGADDVVQDVFATLWDRAPQLRITSDVRAYLLTATRNQSLKLISKTKRADRYALELAACFDEAAASTDERANYRELCAVLDEAVEKLPVSMKAVYKKNKDEELSHRSIAEELGITEHSSRTILNRAVALLRLKLSPLLSLFFILSYTFQK